MIAIFAILGLLISIYALYVKTQLKKNKHYKPACDIDDKISCSAVLKSPYANLFYLPNALVGIVYYFLILLLLLAEMMTLLLVFASVACMLSLVLAYLMLKLKKTCLVCIASYVVNIALFVTLLL